MTDANHNHPWRAYYTETAENFLIENAYSQRVAEKHFEYRRILEKFPDLSRVYDPSYPAARPPFPCRVISIPDTPFNIYYLKEEETRTIVLFSIQYGASDPRNRF